MWLLTLDIAPQPLLNSSWRKSSVSWKAILIWPWKRFLTLTTEKLVFYIGHMGSDLPASMQRLTLSCPRVRFNTATFFNGWSHSEAEVKSHHTAHHSGSTLPNINGSFLTYVCVDGNAWASVRGSFLVFHHESSKASILNFPCFSWCPKLPAW